VVLLLYQDVSPKFRWNLADDQVARKIIEFDKTPEAIRYFAANCERLTDYAYWFFLSTLWVSYTGFSDLNLWRRLFASDRPGRKQSIMKPSEIEQFDLLPWFIKAYRVHRENETDWIAYTLDLNVACRFASERETKKISEYRIKKRDVLALFLRRNEYEIIVLDKSKAQFIGDIEVVYTGDDDMVRITCPNCKKEVRVTLEIGNMSPTCPDCGNVIDMQRVINPPTIR
jgi:hypothetical protein